MSPRVGSRVAKLSIAAAAVVALAFVGWTLVCGECLRDGGGSLSAMPSLLAAGSHATETPLAETPAVVAPDSPLLRPIAQVEEALFVKGSLRGTEYPAWGIARGEPVKPNRALRDRFDYYLLALNEASLAELTALLKSHAERDLGAAAAADILAVWERYLQLQQHKFTRVANPGDPSSMQAALQEHQQVRQSLLGLHWAQAFYGDEEKVLADTLVQGQNGVALRQDADHALFVPPPGADPQRLHQQRIERFGAEAAERLQALDAEEARWDQRLARARAEIEAIRRNPGLSGLQRDEAVARYLEGAYPDANERLRAVGLLGA